jgi:hypothetical protein
MTTKSMITKRYDLEVVQDFKKVFILAEKGFQAVGNYAYAQV